MQLMVEGDKWEMYIPSDLAYGDRGRPPKIGGGDCLIFTMVRHSMPKVTTALADRRIRGCSRTGNPQNQGRQGAED